MKELLTNNPEILLPPENVSNRVNLADSLDVSPLLPKLSDAKIDRLEEIFQAKENIANLPADHPISVYPIKLSVPEPNTLPIFRATGRQPLCLFGFSFICRRTYLQ